MAKFNSVEEVGTAYRNEHYSNKLEYPSARYFKENQIFDEEKSVKWNREERERRIEAANKKREEYNKEQVRLNKMLKEDIIAAILNEYDFNEKQAEKIYDYAYEEKHSHMNDMFYFIVELADLFKELQKISKKEE